ncbi:hypothetical protein K0M31_010993 [Melipona bicolor]|uniref:Uncharacterized protein n=1 Tax=Melipona bicolor TaxID=60889 RepID=A0AA40FKZ4_9HYME|nr:hypothetical protein K0M31_010993 [Melipona bicolor]
MLLNIFTSHGNPQSLPPQKPKTQKTWKILTLFLVLERDPVHDGGGFALEPSTAVSSGARFLGGRGGGRGIDFGGGWDRSAAAAVVVVVVVAAVAVTQLSRRCRGGSERGSRLGRGGPGSGGTVLGERMEAVGVTWARVGPASAKWLEVRRVIHGRAKGCATLRVRPAAAARERNPREHLSPPRNREHPARTAPPTTTTPIVTRETNALPPRLRASTSAASSTLVDRESVR